MCLGIPAKVIRIDDASQPMPMGEIDVLGERRPCCFAYLPEAQPGDFVLIQNSFAMTLIDATAAAEALAAIDQCHPDGLNNR